MKPDTEAIAAFVAGFVAGEGCFSGASDGSRFVFKLGLGASDRAMCDSMRDFFGIGCIYEYAPRKDHYDGEAQYQIGSHKQLIETLLPFMEEHLPPSHKREQYLDWRARLLDFWEHKAKRVRPCTVDGCDEPRRAHGLCRRHLYEVHGV